MRLVRWLIITLLWLLLHPGPALALDIPAFTPNVVDPAGHLDESGRRAVNDELQAIRERSHIWGAVFIVDTLKGEPIESVANEAFEKWKLGQKGVDNGLLLVLAIQDHKSRFEVGYGLEGVVTDVVALHALDSRLAPKMRSGDTAGAIVDAFEFLSQVVEKDPDAVRELDYPQKDDSMHWRRGLIAWGVLVAAIWLCFPLRNRWVEHRRARLQTLDPTLRLGDEAIVNAGDGRSGKAGWKGNWMLQAFLSLNPGIFVVVLSAWFAAAFYISIAATLLIAFLVIHLSARRYDSPERYRAYLDSITQKRADLIQRGFVEEREPGVFGYTAAYYASRKASASSPSDSSSSWSSSDRSDSSSSSSSDGGSSGGGGASSSW